MISLVAQPSRITVAVQEAAAKVVPTKGDCTFTIDSGTSRLIISPAVDEPTNLQVTSGAPGSDIAFSWTAGAGATSYIVQVHDNLGMRREFTTIFTSAVYDVTEAVNDGGHKRSYTIKVASWNPSVGRSDFVELVVENAAPATPTGIKVTEAMTGFTVSCQNTLEGDYAGMIVWASATAGVTLDDAHKVYDDYSQTAVIYWPSPPEAYFVIARYDTFGKVDLNVSSEFTGTLLNNPGVNVVDTLPGTTYLGQDVVYYSGDESLYYWDTDLDPDSYRRALPLVVADQIYSIDLAAISAVIGQLNVGQMVVESTGYIQSSNYVAGTSGYKLDDESIEIKDGTFYGSLSAATGTLGTLTMASGGYVQSSNYVSGTTGWKLTETGAEFNTGVTMSYASVTGAPAGSGVNILPAKYSLFEAATLPVITEFNAAYGSYTRSASTSYFGKGALYLSATAANYGVYFGASKTDYNIPITPGKKWIVSAYVRGSLASMPGQIYFRLDNGGANTFVKVTDFTTSASAGAWTRVSGTIDLTAYSDTSFLLRVDNDNASGNLFFDGLMVEQQLGDGTDPSPFVRGTDDVAASLEGGTTITAGGITMASGGSIKGGQTDYNTGTGWFLGYSSGAYKFSIGSPAGNRLTWDGSSLIVGGTVDYTSENGSIPELKDDTTHSTTETSWTKIREFYIARSGVVNCYYSIHQNSGGTGYFRIYVNGVATGVQRTTSSTTKTYYSESISVNQGDLLQVYAYVTSGVALCNDFQLRSSNPVTHQMIL